jgi:2-oxo-4-hydroxy-4-carboxy-5-ureidoimidazoline decarboxylase
MTSTTRLDTLNRAADTEVAEQLSACNASPRWIAQVLAGRPYLDVETLLDTAERAARALPWSEVRRALDAHPRIGDRPAGESVEAQWSRREQSAVATADARTRDALQVANAAYDERFGHVFLVRAAGRTSEDMLAEVHRRLGNDDATERTEVTGQLAEITRLRLQQWLTG